MPDDAGNPSTSIRDRFLADHAELEELFARLLAAFEAKDRERVASVWAEFDERLSRHMRAEEHFMIPQMSSSRPRDARAILEEHRHIRSRLLELGFGVDLHTVRLEAARGFIDELRAHARHEDDALYRWVDENLTTGERGTVLAALTAPLRTRAATAKSAGCDR